MVGKTALGKYRLLRVLGSGSNAEVFLAEPVRAPEFRVVVKRIHEHVVEHPRFRQLFEAEVRSMANFDHPYAVRLVEASLDDPIGPCLVMEYVPGVTLEDLLAKHKRLAPERVGRLLGCFCHALQAAHDAGIVHRDLKPANLMVTNPDTPLESLKVMDFGFAGFAAKPHIQLAELTGHGPMYAIGTPGYVSPEMIRGDRVDGRSDLYSVGVILFEMLTGRLPFTHQFQDRLLAAHIQEPPPRFHRIGCGFIPAAVEGVVQLALCEVPQRAAAVGLRTGRGVRAGMGADYWSETAPAEWEPPPSQIAEEIVEERPAVVRPTDPFHVIHEFEAFLPDRMAAAKLRGFVEDFGGGSTGERTGPDPDADRRAAEVQGVEDRERHLRVVHRAAAVSGERPGADRGGAAHGEAGPVAAAAVGGGGVPPAQRLPAEGRAQLGHPLRQGERDAPPVSGRVVSD